VKGQELDFLHPLESLDPVIHELQPEKAGPLRNWLVYHQAFLLEQALGPDALLTVQPGRLRLESYQLVPALRAIRMSRPRLLLADGVGLGKTIQAGLVLTELIARRIAHRILIVSPAGPLLDQWKVEMRERFGLRLEVIDRACLEEVRKLTELGANPFDHIPLGLVSIDFLKQERILDQLDRSAYDAVVIDEAHHCMDLGAAGDREDSQRRKLAQVLARRCDAFLLLTATPHDGNDRSFASLCELLDPSLVTGNGSLRSENYRGHVVRRLKRHIKNTQTGEPLFKERIVNPIAIVPDEAHHRRFMELQRSLLDLIAPELRRAFRARRFNDVLSFIALLKRSVSTVAACLSTLLVVAERFQKILTEGAEGQESKRQRLSALRDYQRKLERFGATTAEEEEERHLLEVEDLAQHLAVLQREVRSGSQKLKRTADVVAALDDLVRLGEEALGEDPKIEKLISEIKAIRATEPEANVLVYTEYTTSQQAVLRALRSAGLGDIITMSGADDDRTRAVNTERFRSRNNLVLVSTDAAAEGLNLHERCHHLIHLELPFNPNRLEQRNGRIDRYGQNRNPIVRYFYLYGTFEDRILLRLIRKYERQRARLTFVPNTLGAVTADDAVSERLLKGLLDEDARLFQDDGHLFNFNENEENEGADEATSELLEEIDRCLNGFEKASRTHTWLGETGMNAAESLQQEAQKAQDRGNRFGPVDLSRFVIDAIRLDGGEVNGETSDEIFEVILPPAWSFGLDDLPGYDPSLRKLRLTNRLDVIDDGNDNAVGLLGRAHPLLRRVLDRVRNISFGGSTSVGQDIRASAVSADVTVPKLLYTFVGRIMSQAGREFERIMAVYVGKDRDCRTLLDATDWLSFADLTRSIRPTGLWEKYFADWGESAALRATEAARLALNTTGKSFLSEHHRMLESEKDSLQKWLEQRTREITGDQVIRHAQLDLFAPSDKGKDDLRKVAGRWESLTDSADRLSSFAADRDQPSARRSEADGVLRLYSRREQDISSRLDLSQPEIVPLGVLMLIPEVRRGA
jgi:superfamily II DNA or RNA helicase